MATKMMVKAPVGHAVKTRTALHRSDREERASTVGQRRQPIGDGEV